MERSNIERIIINYLDGSISEADSKKLLSWLQSSGDNRDLFIDYYNLWNRSNNGQFDAEKAFAHFVASMHETEKAPVVNKTRKTTLYKHAALAAACIGAIIIALSTNWIRHEKDDIVGFANKTSKIDLSDTKTRLILSDTKTLELEEKDANIKYSSDDIKINEENSISKQESSTYNQLITPYGKRSTIVFSDGSKAWINSGTRLIYPVEFKKDKREIYVDGEIYIEVSEDKARPFIVKSASIDVKVLGTKFNVSAYNSDIQKRVVLVSGSVQILPKNSEQEEVILKPKQMYTISQRESNVEYTDVSKHISWIDGFYYFDSMKLGDILNRLERYYQQEILFDNDVAELKCSGKLDLKDDLGEVLKGLMYTVPIKCTQEPDNLYSIKLNK